MANPLQPLTHSDPGRLANGPNKRPCEAKPLEASQLSHQSPQKMCPVLRNLHCKLLIKETSLQDMKNELEIYKESSVQQSLQIRSLRDDIKDLQSLTASLVIKKTLKSTNSQSLERSNWDLTARIIELENRLNDILHRVRMVETEKARQKADILEKTWPCPTRFLPHMNLKRQEDFLDIFPVKDKGEAILATNFERDKTFYSEALNDGQQIWDKCLQDLIHKEDLTSEFDRPSNPCSWEATAEQSQHQNFLGQLATLLSDSIGPIPATEDAVKERIQDIGASEQSWKSRTEDLQQEMQMLTKRLKQLHAPHEDAAGEAPLSEEYCREQKSLKHLDGEISFSEVSPGRQDAGRKNENSRTQTQADKHKKFKHVETLLNIQQNMKTPRMEEKIQKLQKQLSDLKLSNKNMKTQLTRINVLKDKTIEKLRQSITKVETMKEKAVPKTDNLKTTLDSGEQEGTSEDKTRASHMPASVTPEPPTVKSTPKGVTGQEQELVDFRETIMKMLGFNMKTADKEVINQLRLIIQVYEIANKSKPSGGETGPET